MYVEHRNKRNVTEIPILTIASHVLKPDNLKSQWWMMAWKPYQTTNCIMLYNVSLWTNHSIVYFTIGREELLQKTINRVIMCSLCLRAVQHYWSKFELFHFDNKVGQTKLNQSNQSLVIWDTKHYTILSSVWSIRLTGFMNKDSKSYHSYLYTSTTSNTGLMDLCKWIINNEAKHVYHFPSWI